MFRFDCPAPLAARGFLLRPENAGDVVALRHIYFEHRQAEFHLLPMSGPQLASLIQSQFDMQRRHYARQYPGAAFLALVERGETIGRLYLAEAAETVWVLDILLRGDRRGKGIATLLLDGLLACAAALDRRVCLHVDKASPAVRLYQRLGFRPVAETDIAWSMQVGPRIA